MKLENGKSAEGFNAAAKEIAMKPIKDFRKLVSEMSEEEWKTKARYDLEIAQEKIGQRIVEEVKNFESA